MTTWVSNGFYSNITAQTLGCHVEILQYDSPYFWLSWWRFPNMTAQKCINGSPERQQVWLHQSPRSCLFLVSHHGPQQDQHQRIKLQHGLKECYGLSSWPWSIQCKKYIYLNTKGTEKPHCSCFEPTKIINKLYFLTYDE